MSQYFQCKSLNVLCMFFPVQQYINNRRNWLLLWSYCMPLQCSLSKFTIIWVTNWGVWQMKGCFCTFQNSVFSWNTDLSSFFLLEYWCMCHEFTINLIHRWLFQTSDTEFIIFAKIWQRLSSAFDFSKRNWAKIYTYIKVGLFFFLKLLANKLFSPWFTPCCAVDNKWSVVDWTERSLKQVFINS